jgi:hypothetical protein
MRLCAMVIPYINPASMRTLSLSPHIRGIVPYLAQEECVGQGPYAAVRRRQERHDVVLDGPKHLGQPQGRLVQRRKRLSPFWVRKDTCVGDW